MADTIAKKSRLEQDWKTEEVENILFLIKQFLR